MRRNLACLAVTAICFCILAVSVHAQETLLRGGQSVYGSQEKECAGSFLDTVFELCKLIPGCPNGSCCSNDVSCRTYKRQIFTGTRLGPAIPMQGTMWNGMGGSGELMADALICMLRELSPQLKGPIKTPPLSIDLGLGKVTVVQEIGFKGFQRVNPKFNGYRKIMLSLPVVGKAEAITQDITVTKRSYGVVGGPLRAGDRPIQKMFALDVATEEKQRKLTITPPGFTIPTPIGAFEASPLFSYVTRTSVVAQPYKAPNLDIANFLGSANRVRFSDLFGLDPGIAATTKKVSIYNVAQNRTGWLSQLGLGTRATHVDTSVWSAPATGPSLRPDLDPYTARSTAEAQPSIDVTAQATVKYPKDPKSLLPSWVFSLPGVSWDAYITVTPKIEASAAGQFTLGNGEGSDYIEVQEFRFSPRRFASSSLVAGLRAAASFSTDVRLVINVTADFPFVDTIHVVDVDVKIPVPLYKPDPTSSAAVLGGAISTGGELPETLDLLRTPDGSQYIGGPATKSFIDQCYAPTNQPPANQPVAEPAEPGQPKDLFADSVLWPCNICVAMDAVYRKPVVPGAQAVAPGHYETVMSSKPPAPSGHWRCDMGMKSGCMDLCNWTPATGAFTIARGPKDIVALLPASDKNRTRFLNCDLGVVR